MYEDKKAEKSNSQLGSRSSLSPLSSSSEKLGGLFLCIEFWKCKKKSYEWRNLFVKSVAYFSFTHDGLSDDL